MMIKEIVSLYDSICAVLAPLERFQGSDGNLGGVQEEVGHDAVQLLDRAMMAPEGAAADAMCSAAPASLYLAVCQDTQHSRDALPLLSAISNLTGPLASPATLLLDLSAVT